MRANSPNTRRRWCVWSSLWARLSPAIRGRRTPGACTSSPAVTASTRTIFTGRLGAAPACADDLDLESDRRSRLVALQRGDAARACRKHRSRVRATSASARIRRRSMRSPTGSPSPKDNGSPSTATAGDVSSIATRRRRQARREGACSRPAARRAGDREILPPARRRLSQHRFARSFFLSIFPTEVSGSSATKVTFSGIAILEMRPRST